MDAADRASFPDASRVVRLGDAGWNSEDGDLLRQLFAVIAHRAVERQPRAVESIIEPLPRVRCGDAHAYLLFGPRLIYYDQDSVLKVDVCGLVFEPIARVNREGDFVIRF